MAELPTEPNGEPTDELPPPVLDLPEAEDPSPRCKVCSSLLDEEDLFCSNCGLEVPARPGAQEQPKSVKSTHNFQCNGCGASMSYDASAQALRCPFCGSTELARKATHRTIAPNRVIPFRLTADQAISRLRASLDGGFWRPGDLAQKAAIDKITPVYVPYWVFRAKTYSYWTADTSQTPPGARGDWRPLAGRHVDQHQGMLVGASGALTPGETASLAPFDLASGVPLGQIDANNVTIEQFGVPRKYARPIARQGLEQEVRNTVAKKYVPGRSRNVHVSQLAENLSSEPVLLPVFIMAYRYQDKLYRFLVNGQTGQATGDAPVSYKKVWAIVGIGLGIAALIFAMLACGGVLSALS